MDPHNDADFDENVAYSREPETHHSHTSSITIKEFESRNNQNSSKFRVSLDKVHDTQYEKINTNNNNKIQYKPSEYSYFKFSNEANNAFSYIPSNIKEETQEYVNEEDFKVPSSCLSVADEEYQYFEEEADEYIPGDEHTSPTVVIDVNSGNEQKEPPINTTSEVQTARSFPKYNSKITNKIVNPQFPHFPAIESFDGAKQSLRLSKSPKNTSYRAKNSTNTSLDR